MSRTNPYRPITCGLHDRLLDWDTRRGRVQIRYRDAIGYEDSLCDVVIDVWTEDSAEYLRTAGGTVTRRPAVRLGAGISGSAAQGVVNNYPSGTGFESKN